MPDRSPMLNRIRGKIAAQFKRTRSVLPRKGRLRICAAVVVAVAWCAAVGFLKRPSHTVPAAAVPASHQADTALTAGAPQERSGTGCGPSLGSAPDFGRVRALFSRRPPRLTNDKDTICSGRDTVIAFYSLDTGLQKFIGSLLRQYRPRYGAGVVLDPLSGRVLALVSSKQDTLPELGPQLFLRNVFPAASIYKTVTAAAAIETAQYDARTVIPAAGRNHTLYRFQLKKDIDPWQEITLEDAFAKSVNSVFARIGMHVVGKRALAEYSGRFGYNTAIPFELAVDSSRVDVPDDTTYAMAELSSGFNRKTTLTALHGALMAAAVAADGGMPRPSFVDSICRKEGPRIFRAMPQVWKAPISPATATQLRSMMHVVADAGTGRKAFRTLRACAWSAGLEYGGKTGSIVAGTLGKVDWFIGYAIDLNRPERRLAVSMVTVHGEYWTVHSSFIGAEIFRVHFRPPRNSGRAGTSGAIVRSDSLPALKKTKG